LALAHACHHYGSTAYSAGVNMLVGSGMIWVLIGEYKPWRAIHGWKQLLANLCHDLSSFAQVSLRDRRPNAMYSQTLAGTRSVVCTAERTVPATMLSCNQTYRGCRELPTISPLRNSCMLNIYQDLVSSSSPVRVSSGLARHRKHPWLSSSAWECVWFQVVSFLSGL
jgi:hypothetical protein